MLKLKCSLLALAVFMTAGLVLSGTAHAFDIDIAKRTFDKTGVAVICARGGGGGISYGVDQLNSNISKVVSEKDFAIISQLLLDTGTYTACVTVRSGGDGRR